MDDFLDPVVVTGEMTVMSAHTDIARTGDRITAGSIVPAE